MKFKSALLAFVTLSLPFQPVFSQKNEYFYFWTESYEAMVNPDGTTFVSAKLKTSTTGKYDISVNDKVIAKDFFIIEDEVTEFPIIVSKKYTQDEKINLCALKKDDKVEFQNVVCLGIQLVK